MSDSRSMHSSREQSLGQAKTVNPLKRLEGALADSEKRHLLALEAAGLGTWLWNISNDHIAWDSRCKALLGLPESTPDLTYQDFLRHIHSDDVAATDYALRRCRTSRSDYDIVHRVVWPDSSVHWLRCKGGFLQDHIHVTGVAIDVTEAKLEEEERSRIEEELRRTNEELDRSVRGHTYELERKKSQVVELAKLLDLANDAIFIVNADDRISFWNKGAERLYGWSRKEVIGRRANDLLRAEWSQPLTDVLKLDHWEGELCQSRRDGTKVMVLSRWTTLRSRTGEPTARLRISTDISARKAAEEIAATLASRLLEVQDGERRKFAGELHDSTGQSLAVLNLKLSLMHKASSGATATERDLLTECMGLADEITRQIRTVSYLLHPPLLDETGLVSALKWLLDGVRERSQISVTFDAPAELERLHPDLEIALFRIVQEALTNIHRHSGSKTATVLLSRQSGNVILQVRDSGVGIAAEKLAELRTRGAGVGIAGMRERLHKFRGSLDIRSSKNGTEIYVCVPVDQRAERQAAGA